MTMTETELLPPGFALDATVGTLTVQWTGSRLSEIWLREEITAGSWGLPIAQRRALRDLAAQNGLAYATGKTGRPGWNVRKTFPVGDASRRLPFLVATPDAIYRFRYSGASRVVDIKL